MFRSGFGHYKINLEKFLVGNDSRLKLTDFESATRLDVVKIVEYGRESYMAPEMHSSRGYNGPHIDIFAIGVCFFTMYVGRPPWMNTKDCPYFKRFKNNSDKLFENHSNRNLDPRVTNLIKGLLAISIRERMEAY
jgi:serine/threonine protein kinase